MNEPLLVAEALDKAYGVGGARIDVLRGLSLAVRPGEAVAIVGESGVGKSTLLHLLGGLDRPDAGRMSFAGLDVFSADTERMAEYRNRSVGFVFQFHHLLPEFSAVENVAMPFRIGRRAGEIDAPAREMLERLGLGSRLTHRPSELSGGEQQRVAIARALVGGPRLVLADEPTGNLDPTTGRRVFELLRELQRERGFALVLASHNERLAVECDRVLRLSDGSLNEMARAETRLYFNGFGTEGSSDAML
ncbi:MAG TPA: ABC transporter ATP-binding protein [Candidatus Polarisedimenticolaceae bacterium]|nr:ABC transporter ATP-binding protein [Candidatus Polarisedimenticolaceae bacterium]